MEYRSLGKAGIKLSELSFGSWITFGSSLDLSAVKQCIRIAFEAGVNFFDNAEAYGNGVSEMLMGEAIKDYRREDLVISTKLFWGGKGPNATGLSWKHLVEGTKNSLRRMNLSYVDLLYCHRPDPTTPIEETVRAMDWIIKSGLAFYWGTSEWSREQIEKAIQFALSIHAVPPSMEQPEYNLFHRQRVENEYAPLYEKYGLGITSWSPLDSGVLTGKYINGIPSGSRMDRHPELKSRLTQEKMNKVRKLSSIAEELNCTMAQLAVAWCLKNPHISSVITGATSPHQVAENLQSVFVKHQLNEEYMKKIDEIVNEECAASKALV